jgi:hypothetical protein
LHDLWRRRLDTLLSGIANRDSYYLQIANAAEHLSAEYHGRFLIELLQNANDQAVRAGLTSSLVTIHRTADLLAVGNSGQPFDDRKIDAITSIFQSDKAADECIGNKGIGFKAVFQVADSAEIFSSTPGGNLAEACATGFRIVREPFEDDDFRGAIRGIAGELLDGNHERLRKVEALFSGEVALDAVMREASRAAWFTFPLPCGEGYFRTRASELGLSIKLLRATQTLVVLPLDGASRSRSGVDSAIDEIRGADGGSRGERTGASFLFLPGIGGITVIDRVRRFRAELEKRDTTPAEKLVGGVTLRRQQTTRRLFDLTRPESPPAVDAQDWWVAERVIGGGEGERAAQERDAIREAIQTLRLPEENWRGIEKVPVAVALPAPRGGNDHSTRLLGPNGRFCIGLPTRVPTGSPLWVSAHFHGKIDRTAIDFDSAYNHLLFDAAVELSGALLQRLKGDSEEAARRLVTLAMERGLGELAGAFYGDCGIARTEIVLRNNGSSFLKASELRLPRATDLPIFLQLVAGADGVEGYGFRLPDAALLQGAREILDSLAQNTAADDALYLRRPPGGPSLLEHAAATHRKDGPAFWEPFLAFVLDRFGVQQADALAEQVILPTGRSELASAKSRVFFPPVRVAARATDDEDRPQAIDDGGEELAAIDETVLSLLKFFDDTAISVRTGTARDYAPLAQKLAPDDGRGLVRRPRQEDLINDALIPVMRESRGDNDRMLALLRQALLWLVGTPQKSKQRIATDNLLVPVSGPGEAWNWVEASSAYLGEGWDTDPAIALLTKAFGNRPGKQLIAWDRFEKKAIQRFKEVDRRWWLERMKEIGVAGCPRLIRTPRLPVARSWSQHQLTPEAAVGCPVPCPAPLWRSYLTHIARRGANTRSGQHFFLNEVCWIEGLEEDAIRTVVVEAMLRKPGRYDRHVRSKLSRYGGEDSSDVPALWLYALRTGDWETIPTSRGLCSPARSWFLPLESRGAKADRFAFLPCVKAEFSSARDLLKSLGVVTVEEAHIPRLAKALQEVAGYVGGATFEEARHIDALASDLYEAIQGRLEAGESADAVKKVLDAPVPLLKDERIGQASLKEVAQIWIDDDPIRRRHISGFTDCWVIPKRFQHTYSELVNALRGILGPGRVVRVSESPIDVRFTPLEDGTILLDYMRHEFPDRPLAEDLGLLILKGGGHAASPHDKAFRLAWGRVERTRVVRGRFEGASAVTACFDGQRDGGPALLVDSSLSAHEVVGETWQLVGPSYRPIWGAYTQALRDDATERFFQDYGVSSAERMEVCAAIRLGFEQRLWRYQPVCLALWRRTHPDRLCDDFHSEWNQHARTPESAAQWLASDDLLKQIELAAGADEPQDSLLLLRSLGLSVSAWQTGRRELGKAPWRFASSERAYESARDALAGHVMAWFAYLVVPRASGGSGPTLPAELGEPAGAWAERIRAMAVPANVAEEDLPTAAIVARAARDAVECAGEEFSTHEEARVLLEPVRNLSTAALSEVSSIKLKDEPDKAATVYERDDAATRAQQATATVDDVVKIATALAPKHGEELKDGAIRDHALVALLSQGTWANRVSVLAAVRYAVEGLAPGTAGRMKDRQAFRDFDDWRALWRKFEELGSLPAPVMAPVAKPTFTVVGSGWTQDAFAASAAQGSTGAVAQRLAAAVNLTIDLAAMRALTRAKVQIATTPGSGIGGGAGGRRRTPDEYLAMLGAAGEYFVYEQLKAVCRDFDATNWLSKAREAFGYGPGDDSLGYDFAYDDVGGVFVGPAGVSRRCMIEVKSSAQGGGSSFEMSMNEWEVARRCHQDPSLGTYVILRVADIISTPRLTDVLVDPVGLHLQGVLNYTSRDLLVVLGKAK